MQSNFYVFDTETTGLNEQVDGIIQLSAIKCDLSQGVVSEFDYILKYEELDTGEMYINPKAQAVHGITDAIIKEKGVHAKTVFEDFVKFTKMNTPYKEYLLAYNSPFDVKFMLASFKRFELPYSFVTSKVVDVLECAMRLIPTKQIPNYKLTTVLHHLKLEQDDDKAHDSLSDVKMTARVFIGLYKLYCDQRGVDPSDEIFYGFINDWYFSHDKPLLVPYGKHKGSLWKDVPTDYLVFCVNSFSPSLFKSWMQSELDDRIK